MSLHERIKSAASNISESVTNESQEAEQAARDARLSKTQRRAAARARQRAAAAAGQLGRAGATGSATPDVSRDKSRTQLMFERAEHAATAGAPVDVSMDPTPSPMGMWEFATAGNDAEPTAYESDASYGVDTEADWGDNPSNFDAEQDVQASVRVDGLDPVDDGDDHDSTLDFDDPFGATAGFGGGGE